MLFKNKYSMFWAWSNKYKKVSKGTQDFDHCYLHLKNYIPQVCSQILESMELKVRLEYRSTLYLTIPSAKINFSPFFSVN